ncbi:MAG: DUF2237 domain-containing protein [Rickettsiales bacterium]|nr:DUF2237 domain-containing protein [Rickettsiales bacterium]
MDTPRNVLGGPLELCCDHPVTGYFRDGYCRTDHSDHGKHVICAIVTEAFLIDSMARGNDLVTPRPEYQFPGLKPGDRWCLCAIRWREAMEAGIAPQVCLEATHSSALEVVTLAQLQAHAFCAVGSGDDQ